MKLCVGLSHWPLCGSPYVNGLFRTGENVTFTREDPAPSQGWAPRVLPFLFYFLFVIACLLMFVYVWVGLGFFLSLLTSSYDAINMFFHVSPHTDCHRKVHVTQYAFFTSNFEHKLTATDAHTVPSY